MARSASIRKPKQQDWRGLNDALPSETMQQKLDDKLTLILTELWQHLTTLYGARLVDVVLFGSQACDDAVVGSDIDVLIVLKGTVSQFEQEALFTKGKPPPNGKRLFSFLRLSDNVRRRAIAGGGDENQQGVLPGSRGQRGPSRRVAA